MNADTIDMDDLDNLSETEQPLQAQQVTRE
jgi:hypothetical protein